MIKGWKSLEQGWKYIISDVLNNRLYREVGTVKNNVLNSYGTDMYTNITAEKRGTHTLRFTYTSCEPISRFEGIIDGQIMTSAMRKQLSMSESWKLSEPEFSGIRHMEVVKWYMSAELIYYKYCSWCWSRRCRQLC